MFRNHIFKKRPKKDLKIAPRWPRGGGPNSIFFSEFLLFFFRGRRPLLFKIKNNLNILAINYLIKNNSTKTVEFKTMVVAPLWVT
jgi:hypothetical protein